MADQSQIARRIFRVMSDHGVSKAELARKAAFNASYLTLLESGKIQEPSPARLREIADALGVRPNDLIEPPPVTPSDAFYESVRAALGTGKAHLFEATVEALRELPAAERDRAIEIIHTLATNWPRSR